MAKLKGFRASHRNKWFLITSGKLSFREFLLFELYIDLMDFDGDHDKFGTVEVFFDEIAAILNSSKDSVRIWHKGLQEKGFIREYDKKRKLFQIATPKRYGIDQRKGGDAYFYAKTEKVIDKNDLLLLNVSFSSIKAEESQDFDVDLALDDDSKALTSYKGESKVSLPACIKEVIDSYGPELTEEDKDWINKNVSEEE